jgi:hypothetical protein
MTDSFEPKTTLLNAAKRHWRSFAPIWIFPFWFMFGGLAVDKTQHPTLIFIFIFAPLFFWSFFRGTRVWMRREIQYSHYSFLAFVVPMLIWVVIVYGRIFILKMLE